MFCHLQCWAVMCLSSVCPITAYLRGKERGSDNTALILLYLLKALICSVLIPPPAGTCMHNDCSLFFRADVLVTSSSYHLRAQPKVEHLNKTLLNSFLLMFTASAGNIKQSCFSLHSYNAAWCQASAAVCAVSCDQRMGILPDVGRRGAAVCILGGTYQQYGGRPKDGRHF